MDTRNPAIAFLLSPSLWLLLFTARGPPSQVHGQSFCFRAQDWPLDALLSYTNQRLVFALDDHNNNNNNNVVNWKHQHETKEEEKKFCLIADKLVLLNIVYRCPNAPKDHSALVSRLRNV